MILNNIDNAYLGNSAIDRIYCGDTLIWPIVTPSTGISLELVTRLDSLSETDTYVLANYQGVVKGENLNRFRDDIDFSNVTEEQLAELLTFNLDSLQPICYTTRIKRVSDGAIIGVDVSNRKFVADYGLEYYDMYETDYGVELCLAYDDVCYKPYTHVVSETINVVGVGPVPTGGAVLFLYRVRQ